MADTQVKAHVAGPEAGGVMRRLNMFTGIAAGVILAVIGYFVSKALLPSPDDSPYTVNQVDAITMACWVIGFMIGVGAFAGPFKWLAGRDPTRPLRLGFALVTGPEGRVVPTAAGAASAGRVRLRFADGSVGARVEGEVEEARP